MTYFLLLTGVVSYALLLWLFLKFMQAGTGNDYEDPMGN